jgi:hypothetical protein
MSTARRCAVEYSENDEIPTGPWKVTIPASRVTASSTAVKSEKPMMTFGFARISR